jgi:XTP/dITP diphosphohydrolase
MKLVFATHNKHKLKEIREILEPQHEIKGLTDLQFFDDIPETGDTLEENADIKSMTIWEKFGLSCFSDDTGLEVEALNGAPGVYSARYAGEGCSFDDNMNKLLEALKGETNRKARFRSIVSLVLNGETKHFEGIVEGVILESRQGEEGFGYDPIFKPNESNLSFAEMSSAAKNEISHRGRAIQKLTDFLKTIQ